MKGIRIGSDLYQPRLVRHHPHVENFPEMCHDGFVDVAADWINLGVAQPNKCNYEEDEVKTNLQLGNIPIFNFSIRRVIRPRDIYSFHYSKRQSVKPQTQ